MVGRARRGKAKSPLGEPCGLIFGGTYPHERILLQDSRIRQAVLNNFSRSLYNPGSLNWISG